MLRVFVVCLARIFKQKVHLEERKRFFHIARLLLVLRFRLRETLSRLVHIQTVFKIHYKPMMTFKAS